MNGTNKMEIASKFEKLVELSNIKYNSLKLIPYSSESSIWKPFFKEAFEIFNNLWSYQQKHRLVLDISRFEIGDIARKIAELYFQYYFRTSDAKYLMKSFHFYEAIWYRKYFRKVTTKVQYTIRLKCYVKFIVVCLFQNKRLLVVRMLGELKKIIDNNPLFCEDETLFRSIHKEIQLFVEDDMKMSIDGNPNQVSYRDQQQDSFSPEELNDLPMMPSPTPSQFWEIKLSLPEKELITPHHHTPSRRTKHHHHHHPCIGRAVLISSGKRSNKIHFVRLTMNMFRMIQSLEKEPIVKEEDFNKRTQLRDDSIRPKNCEKTVLYQTSFGRVMKHLAGSVCEVRMHQNSSLFLYLDLNSVRIESVPQSYFLLNDYPSSSSSSSSQKKKGGGSGSEQIVFPPPKEDSLLSFEDLIPFSLRVPMFLIVDSNEFFHFNFEKRLEKERSAFQKPFMCVYSKSSSQEKKKKEKKKFAGGNLFTFFLTAPIFGFFKFCQMMKKKSSRSSSNEKDDDEKEEEEVEKSFSIRSEHFKLLREAFDEWSDEMCKQLEQSASTHEWVNVFLKEKMMKKYIIRFLFLKNVLLFFGKEEEFKTLDSFPTLPGFLFENDENRNTTLMFIRELEKISEENNY